MTSSGLFGFGCPPRDTGISITSQGADTLFHQWFTNPVCYWQTEGYGGAPMPSQCCEIKGNPPFNWGSQLEARLFLLTPNPLRVRSASKCMTIPQCSDAGWLGFDACFAENINQQLDGAMPNGLTADGLRDVKDALLTLALYQRSSSATTDDACANGTLVACAGLEIPLGGSSYDVACSSRQGTTIERESRACPHDPDNPDAVCFLQYCSKVLEESGY